MRAFAIFILVLLTLPLKWLGLFLVWNYLFAPVVDWAHPVTWTQALIGAAGYLLLHTTFTDPKGRKNGNSNNRANIFADAEEPTEDDPIDDTGGEIDDSDDRDDSESRELQQNPQPIGD